MSDELIDLFWNDKDVKQKIFNFLKENLTMETYEEWKFGGEIKTIKIQLLLKNPETSKNEIICEGTI